MIFEFSFIIEVSKPSFLKVLKTLCLLPRYWPIDVHFGLSDISQFAKWPIYIVATTHMCKFEISKILNEL